MQFAVIKTGGKQYIVGPGTKLRVEKLNAPENGEVVFDEVLLVVDGDAVQIGMPLVSGAGVQARVTGHGRAKKVMVFKYHPKTRYRKKKGHRQPYTEILVEKISTRPS
ncbi:MAG: 50S ribosomal protein L21 [Candidatus Sungbacteria bacterium]|uniref:Large ribosomal subunit protein bL21 n=1 Tax=Candidatus Sungiibacteriota bacterium TaxID=2750080 RepID=A0A932R167_9BACT|nr:50S ribosomal protein L21 [Candidatus Sungbacteria bacterium]